MKKVIFAVLAILIAGGAAGAYWYGNQPKVTYYPSGNIKTSVEQKFFKEDGEYKVFNEDGTLAQKYTVADGIKVGQGFVYAGGVTAEVGFVNGALDGPLKLDTKGKVPEIDNLQMDISGGELTTKINISDSKAQSDAQNQTAGEQSYIIGSRITCDEGEFLNGLQAFLEEQNLDTFKNFTGCLSLTSGKIGSDLYECNYKGAYQYPRFTAESAVECRLTEAGEQILSGMLEDAEFKDIGKLKISLSYSPSDKKFFFQVADDKGLYHNVQSFKGLEEIISATTEFAFSKQDSKDIAKMISDVVNNLTITDSQLEINGKVVSAVKGEFNLVNGFSNPWTASYFGAENVLTSQMKITDKGMVANLIYPISQKPFITAGIQIDESIKGKYKSLVDLVLKEFSEKSEDEAIEYLMGVMPKYVMNFSDVVKSVKFLLMNNKGEKVLGSVLNVKPNTNFMEMADDFFKVFDIRIVSYRNNKPYQDIIGDTTNGFIVNNKVIAPNELGDYLDRETLEKVFKQAEEEYEQIGKSSTLIQKDPVFGEVNEWYYDRMSDENDDTQVNDENDDTQVDDELVNYLDTEALAGAEGKVVEQAAEAPKEAEKVVEQAAEAPAEAEKVIEPVAEVPAEAEKVTEPAAEAPAEAEKVVEQVAEVPAEAEKVIEPTLETLTEAEGKVVEQAAEAPAEAEKVIEPALETLTEAEGKVVEQASEALTEAEAAAVKMLDEAQATDEPVNEQNDASKAPVSENEEDLLLESFTAN